MKVRQIIYFVITRIVNSIINSKIATCFFSLFSFETEMKKLISPGVESWLKSFGFPIAFATFFSLFGVNLLWSLINGRLFPDPDPLIYNFLEDWPNMVNYCLICPVYLTFGLCFIYHLSGLKTGLKTTGLFEALDIDYAIAPKKLAIGKNVAAGLIVFFVSTYTISRYAVELSQYKNLFWFQAMSAGGEKVFLMHGVYYVITNFILNTVIVLIVAMHFEFFSVASLIGKALKNMTESEKQVSPVLLEKDQLANLFLPFSSLYILSKILVVAVLVNMYTWRAQRPDFIGMLDLSILLLAIIGVVVVSYPRYHIQYWLFRLWNSGKVSHHKFPDTRDYPDIRKTFSIGLANLADIVILGGAMTNLILYVFDKSGITLTLL